MGIDHELYNPKPSKTHLTWAVRGPTRLSIPIRRRKLPIARLGGKKPRRVVNLVRMFRRMRLRWLKLHYMRMLKKFKDYCRNLIKDLVDAGATIETFHQRVIMEASLAVPVMGVGLNNCPSLRR